jgi:2-C-methyl-D-erythritol 2,4-cyclodiphosphate synthase
MSTSAFPYRVGQGYDIHALVLDRNLILGGVKVPHTHGLLGHSDADALLHAITDALLGAAALGDIGRHFPDTDAKYKGADSRVLLKATVALIKDAGYQVGNIDATIICQAPKMAPHIPAMVMNIATDLSIDPNQVSVKAKTNEGLGHLGRGEGVAVQAVVMLYKI